MGTLIDQQGSEIEELLFGERREEAAMNVSKWLGEKRKSYKSAAQGGPADPELSALTLMAGLAAERNRESSLNPDMDKGVAAEAAEKAKFAGKIFDQDMVAQNAFGAKVDVKQPNSLNELVGATKDAATLPFGFNGIGSEVAFLQERLRELQTGKASSKEVLASVNTIFHGLNYAGDSLVGNLEKLANPKTTPAEKAALLQGIEKLNKTVSALQAVRRQLETATYEMGAGDPAARSKIDELRAMVAGGAKSVESAKATRPVGSSSPVVETVPTPAKVPSRTEASPLPKSQQKPESPILSPEEAAVDAWMKGLINTERDQLARVEGTNKFSGRTATPIFEALTGVTGSSEKTRQVVQSWMATIQAGVDRLKKAGKTDSDAENQSVEELIASKPAYLAAVFAGARAIEDARFDKFPSNDFGKVRMNPTDFYVLRNIYSNFAKNKKR